MARPVLQVLCSHGETGVGCGLTPVMTSAGAPVTLAPQVMPLPLPAPQVTPSLPVIKLREHPVTMTTISQDGGHPSVGVLPFSTPAQSGTGSDVSMGDHRAFSHDVSVCQSSSSLWYATAFR